MNKIKIIYLMLLLLLVAGSAYAQVKQENTKPLELPAFIIEGAEQHSLGASIKQMPVSPSPLSAQELDSLNTIEKLQPSLLAVAKLPEHYVSNRYSAGYVKAAYGLFNTPEFSAGYRFWMDRFDIFAVGGFALSDGDASHSNNNNIFFDLKSTYVADEKFYIFGGSSTKTNLYFNTQGYNFYGVWEKPAKNFGNKLAGFDRHLTQGKFEVKSDGAFENVLFSVGGSANYILADNNSSASKYIINKNIENTNLNGFLSVKNYWNHFLLSGDINLHIDNTGGKALNYYQFDASGSYFNDNFSVLANVGFQAANNSADISRGGLLLRGEMEYRYNRLWTFNLAASSGLKRADFEDIISTNPYISPRIFIDHRYDIANVHASVFYHPDERVMLSGGANWRYSERNLAYEVDTLSEYKLDYVDGIVMEVYADGMWRATDKDRLLGKLAVNFVSLDNNKNLTYTPLLLFSGTYHRILFKEFGAELTAEVVTDRKKYVSKDGNLGGYLGLSFGVDYTIGNLVITINLNNITNNKIYVWDMYKERGLFASVGLMWKF